MKRTGIAGAALLFVALQLSCVSSTQMIGVWSDPEYRAAPEQKMLVIGLGENESNVRVFESAMANELKRRNIVAIMGSTFIPAGAPLDTTGGRKYCEENGIDLVAVTRVLGLSEEVEYVPGTSYYKPGPSYFGFFPYYYTSYTLVTTPGYLRQYPVATVETNVYSMKDERLIWSGQSRTVDPNSVLDAIDDFAVGFVRGMEDSGVFWKK